jgi:hypothetical protein
MSLFEFVSQAWFSEQINDMYIDTLSLRSVSNLPYNYQGMYINLLLFFFFYKILLFEQFSFN